MTGDALRGHYARQFDRVRRPSQCRWTPLCGHNVRALAALVFHPSFIATRSSRCDRFRERHRHLQRGHLSKAGAGECEPASSGSEDLVRGELPRTAWSETAPVMAFGSVLRAAASLDPTTSSTHGGRAGPRASAAWTARRLGRAGASQHDTRDDPEHDQQQERDQGDDPNDVEEGGAPPVGVLDLCKHPKSDD